MKTQRQTFNVLTVVLFYFLALLPLSVANAAPAYPFPITVSQPDGTQLTILLHGDEYFNWTTTADDVLLAGRGNAWYIADIADNGELTPTLLLAHNAQQRTASEQERIRQQAVRRTLFNQQAVSRIQAARRAPTISTTAHYFPHKGSPRVLIILAAYPDSAFTVTDPVKSFTQYFNGVGQPEKFDNNEDRNVCSVREYFNTVSHGQFTPQFDIVGPVTLPNNMEYYGGSSSTGSDEKLTDLCRDACELVKNEVNFADYDNDGDGKAELVYILHAGTGQNMGGGVNTMWAKCGLINIEVNGTTIIRGGCHSELYKGQSINGIGVLIHEFSHGMGLPDLYVTTSGAALTALNQSMQAFDVMDYGLYNPNLGILPSYAPAAYTAWEQEAMGWITISELTDKQENISVTPLIDGGTAYKIQNPAKPNEYIVIENIQQTGINNGAFGHGLLTYHVDYSSNNVNMGDSPNNTAGHPRVAVIPSGGISYSTYSVYPKDGEPTSSRPYSQDEWKAMLAATPFPGTADVLMLTDSQALPNFLFYTSNSTTPVGHALYGITEDTSTGTVTFSYDIQPTNPVEEELTVSFSDLTEETNLENTLTDNVYYNLDGTQNGYDATEQCLVINTTTDMTAIADATPGSSDVQEKFTGIILEVNGSGTITLDCQTLGTNQLAIQIGKDKPTTVTMDTRGLAEVVYDVKEPTYVYVYVTNSPAAAPQRVVPSKSGILIYSLNVKPSATGINSLSIDNGQRTTDNYWYSLDGRRFNGKPSAKGIYIYQGNRVTIK